MKRQTCSLLLRLLCLLPVFSLGGCTKELGVDLPYAGDRLVLYGFLSPDRVVSLKVSKTYPPTGDHLFVDGIAGATVSLYEDDVFVENLVYIGGGVYLSGSGYKPRVGKAYAVRVSADGFPDAETIPETIPPAVPVDQFTFRDTVISPLNEDFPALKLSFSFTDVPGQVNYYYPDVTPFYQGEILGVNTFDLDRPFGVEDLCSYHDGRRFLLRDLCFADGSFTVNLGIESKGAVQRRDYPRDSVRFNGNPSFDQVELHLNTITRNYYEYLKSTYQPEGLEQAFVGPRPRHTNVKGGYGILAAYNRFQVQVW